MSSSLLDPIDEVDSMADEAPHNGRMSAADKQEALRLAQEADPGVNPFSYRGFTFALIVLCVCLCSGEGGMDAAVMSAINSMTQYQKYFDIRPASSKTSLVFGMYTVGQMASVFPNAYLPDRLGRRWCMLLGNLVLIVGALLSANATSLQMLIGGRWMTGLGAAVAGTSAKMYLAEIASPSTRGRFMGLQNSFYYVGQLCASGLAVQTGRYATDSAWRAPLYVQTVPALINVLFVLLLPESPRYLTSRGHSKRAAQVLADLHSRDRDVNSPLIQLELSEIKEAISVQGSDKAWWDFRSLFRDTASRYRMYLCIMVSIWGQLSGMGLVTYYLTILLAQAGVASPHRQRQLNFLSSITSFSAALTGTSIVDHVGRRFLLKFSSFSNCLCMAIIGTLLSPLGTQSPTRATIGIVFIYVFSTLFSIGWTPMQGLYPSEVLSFQMRSKGLAFQGLVSTVVSCINTFGLPLVLEHLHWKTYYIFSAFDVLGIVVVWTMAVETRQLTLEEMDAVFESKNPRKFAAALHKERARPWPSIRWWRGVRYERLG